MDIDDQLHTPPSRQRKSLNSFIQSAIRYGAFINECDGHPSTDSMEKSAPRRQKKKASENQEIVGPSITSVQVGDKYSGMEKNVGARPRVMEGLEDDTIETDISLDSPVNYSKGRCGRLLFSSTPFLPLKLDVSDNIDRFDSSSEEDQNDTKLSSMIYSLPKRPKRARSFQQPESNTAGGMEDVSICSSSPESEDQIESPECSKMKTSEWINQVVLQDTMDTKSVLGDDSIFPGPSDSSKKRGSLQLTEGGLAERMLKLAQEQKAEILSWQQRINDSSAGERSTGRGLTVQVLSLHSCCSVVVATCRVLHVDPLSHHQHGNSVYSSSLSCDAEEENSSFLPGQEMIVVFSQQTCKFLQVLAGHHIKICPPWTSLMVSSCPVILRAHFSWHVGESPLPPMWSGSSCEHAQTRWQCHDNRVLSRSPSKGLQPTCLFPNHDRWQEPDRKYVHPHEHSKDHQPHPLPGSLLDAVACISDDRLGDLHAVVVRVFRQKGWCDSRCRGIKALPASWRWCLLVMDDCGYCAEVRMPVLRDSCPSWCELVEDGEGKHFVFSDLQMGKHHDPIREPHVFALLASITSQSNKSQKSLLCLEWGVVTQFKQNSETNSVLSSPVRMDFMKFLQNGGAKRKIETRVTFDAKLTGFQSEVSSYLEFGPLRYNNCGHYMTATSRDVIFEKILNMCGPSNTFCREHSPDDDEDTYDLTIYLRPSFVTDGLDSIFTQHGLLLQLKDVELCFDRGKTASFAMDTFSMIFPKNSSDLFIKVYPKIPSNFLTV